MNKLKAIIIACVAIGFTNCLQSGCDDCHPTRELKLPAYANESGIMVKLVIIHMQAVRHEKFIDYGYTLNSSYYYKENSEEWYVSNTFDCGIVNYCDDPIRMDLHFLDSPEKCLIFDGPIEHNGIDMRSWESYKGRTFDGHCGRSKCVEYIYTITPELRAMAKEENCENL
jgi:hypothetical protein